MLLDYDPLSDTLFVKDPSVHGEQTSQYVCKDPDYTLHKTNDEVLSLQINNVAIMSPGNWYGNESREEVPHDLMDAADRWIATCIAVQGIFQEVLDIADLVEKEDSVEGKG